MFGRDAVCVGESSCSVPNVILAFEGVLRKKPDALCGLSYDTGILSIALEVKNRTGIKTLASIYHIY